MSAGALVVKLVRPTDFDILEVLQEHGRNVAPNIAIHMDRDKNYINTRLPQLVDYGLVEKIGPSERSGLYELTDLGEVAIECQNMYSDPDIDFGDLIRDELDRRRSGN